MNNMVDITNAKRVKDVLPSACFRTHYFVVHVPRAARSFEINEYPKCSSGRGAVAAHTPFGDAIVYGDFVDDTMGLRPINGHMGLALARRTGLPMLVDHDPRLSLASGPRLMTAFEFVAALVACDQAYRAECDARRADDIARYGVVQPWNRTNAERAADAAIIVDTPAHVRGFDRPEITPRIVGGTRRRRNARRRVNG